eukprot:6383115-Pyramimonas_sp.AAC.2
MRARSSRAMFALCRSFGPSNSDRATFSFAVASASAASAWCSTVCRRTRSTPAYANSSTRALSSSCTAALAAYASAKGKSASAYSSGTISATSRICPVWSAGGFLLFALPFFAVRAARRAASRASRSSSVSSGFPSPMSICTPNFPCFCNSSSSASCAARFAARSSRSPGIASSQYFARSLAYSNPSRDSRSSFAAAAYTSSAAILSVLKWSYSAFTTSASASAACNSVAASSSALDILVPMR